jgi:hypothetical protein
MKNLKYYTEINGKHTYLYSKFSNMKIRCFDNKRKDYRNYGGRGITIEPYLLDFKNYVDYLYEILPAGKTIDDMKKMRYSIDRINNDGNYERGNLRWASTSDQNLNRRIQKNNTSGFLGVSKLGNKWAALIRINKKKIYIGSYNSSEEAFDAFQKVYLQYHGKEAHARMLKQQKHLEKK